MERTNTEILQSLMLRYSSSCYSDALIHFAPGTIGIVNIEKKVH